MGAALGLGGVILGLSLFAVGLLTSGPWIIAIGMVLIFVSGIVGVRIGYSAS